MKSYVVDEKHLNFIIGIEKKLTNLLKELKESETIWEINWKKLKPRGFRFCVLYGLCKTHKKVFDKCPSFRPFLSTIKTLSYNLANFLVPLTQPPMTKNNFTVTKSSEIPKEVCEQNSEYFKDSYDIESFFNNTSLELKLINLA